MGGQVLEQVLREAAHHVNVIARRPHPSVDRDGVVEQCGVRHVVWLKDIRVQINAGALLQQIPGFWTFDAEDGVAVGLIDGSTTGACREIGQPVQ